MAPPVASRISDELLKLIDQEVDKKDRSILLILYQISQLLENSSNNISDLHEEVLVCREELGIHKRQLDKRFLNYDALINRGKGAWAVTGKVLIVLQALFTAVAIAGSAHYFDTIKRLDALEQAQTNTLIYEEN
jgi:hypothetical protein